MSTHDATRASSNGHALAVESDPPAIELRDVDFSYGTVQALFGVSFAVPQGSVVALLGSNGAGKSTILSLLAGLLRPTAGQVLVGGDDLGDDDVRARVRRGAVLVPEVRGIFPELTVEENLEVAAYMLRRERGLRVERFGEVFEIFPRLAERRRQDASTLSGGERQMLALGKAFLLHPEVLLIDELSLGLSPSMVDVLVEAVAAFRARGTSMLIVEQSINVAGALADHAVIVEKGAVQFRGPMQRLKDDPDLVRAVLLGGHAGEQV
jgi:ABC-type branched-subunit amino acid transport system ATPase component